MTAMTEAQFQRAVLALCKVLHLRVAHFRPARTAKGWATPVSADGAGFPDLVIVGPNGLLFRELKTRRGRTTAEQDQWLWQLTHAGADAHVWRPTDLTDGRISAELHTIAKSPSLERLPQ